MDARHYISKIVYSELELLIEGKIDITQFNYLIDALERQKFVEVPDIFFPVIRKLADDIILTRSETRGIPY